MHISRGTREAFKTVLDDIDKWIKGSEFNYPLDSTKQSKCITRRFVCHVEGFGELEKWMNASPKCKLLKPQFSRGETEEGYAVDVTLTEESRNHYMGNQPVGSHAKGSKRKSFPGLPVEPATQRRSVRIEERKQQQQQQSACLQGGAGLLAGVKVWMLGLDHDEEMTVRHLVEDLGGAVVSLPKEASHALVPLDANSARWEQELWPQLQGLQKNYAASSRKGFKPQIVSINWLEEFTKQDCVAPWDEQMCMAYTPDFVQQALAHGSHRQLNRSRVKSPGGGKQSAKANKPEGANKPDRKQLAGSLKETMDFLSGAALSCDLRPQALPEASVEAPETVLGVTVGASDAEVRAAYKKKVLVNHPDKGGDAKAFHSLQQAYWALLRGSCQVTGRQAGQAQLALPSGGDLAGDFQLRGHKELVKTLFQSDGVDLDDCLVRQDKALRMLGLQPLDLGAVSRNEQNQEIYNQCFYLSLARSYLGKGHQKAELHFMALHMKRTIETEVLAAHPDWSGSRVGEDVQAFSDFLFYVLGTHALLSELSVAIFDSVSGGVELYIGRQFPGEGREEEQRANLLTLRYTPGHYQALVPTQAGATSRPTLAELERSLCEHSVLYVPTVV